MMMMVNATNRAVHNLNNAVEDLEEILALHERNANYTEANKVLSLIEALQALTKEVGEIVYR
jgi:hypothetical protein